MSIKTVNDKNKQGKDESQFCFSPLIEYAVSVFRPTSAGSFCSAYSSEFRLVNYEKFLLQYLQTFPILTLNWNLKVHKID